MNSFLVLLAYAFALGLASFLLYWFGPLSWYWHGLSVALAMTVGLIPPLDGLRGPLYDLAVGFVFILSFVWGAGGAFVTHAHHEHTHHHA
jgi:hypothetical protein